MTLQNESRTWLVDRLRDLADLHERIVQAPVGEGDPGDRAFSRGVLRALSIVDDALEEIDGNVVAALDDEILEARRELCRLRFGAQVLSDIDHLPEHAHEVAWDLLEDWSGTGISLVEAAKASTAVK